MGCFNFEDPNHVLSDCKKPLNHARAAKSRLEYYSKKKQTLNATSQVLYKLSRQLQSEHERNGDTKVMLAKERNDDPTEEYDNALAQLIFGIAPDGDEHTEEPSRSPYDKLIDEKIDACSPQNYRISLSSPT